MGLNLFGGLSSSSFDCNCNSKIDIREGNPNPDNYIILRNFRLENYLAVELRYPDCTNYEGRKILVFKNCTLQLLLNQKQIDPHFSSNTKFYSPIVRFEPTEEGWDDAKQYVTLKANRKIN